MSNRDDFFMNMCKEAMSDLASAEHGTWREISPNTLILACFGMLSNHLANKIVKPMWYFVGFTGAGITGWLITKVLGGQVQ